MTAINISYMVNKLHQLCHIGELLLLTLALWLLNTEPVYANSWPPMAVWLIQVPLGAGFISYGLGLIAIALLEGWILARREYLPLKRAMLLSGLANLCSVTIGFLVIMGLAALPYSAISYLFLGLVVLLLVFFSRRLFSSIALPCFNKYPFIGKLIELAVWGLIWFGVLLISLILIGIVNQINPATVAGVAFPDPNVPFYVNLLQLLAVVCFLAIGFAMSLVSEGFCIAQVLSKSSRELWRTILIMNLRSYAYIAIPITLVFMIHGLA
ncbi:MAG TPA: hypothetical protein DDZ80_29995 [Cyanobacteria bacterium UBA8803]|nr:hypothetical protein [Cyanobacteria bacterium UBA9273]HBL62469.1 hypothetical protein [Cyanobacteria bacterium UBA8803]